MPLPGIRRVVKYIADENGFRADGKFLYEAKIVGFLLLMKMFCVYLILNLQLRPMNRAR